MWQLNFPAPLFIFCRLLPKKSKYYNNILGNIFIFYNIASFYWLYWGIYNKKTESNMPYLSLKKIHSEFSALFALP